MILQNTIFLRCSNYYKQEGLNNHITDSEIQDFIFDKSENRIDITKFILSGSPYIHITIQELAQQISGRIKVKDKLPTWYNTKKIYYPPTINIEQTSSETTAIYKSNLVSGKTLIDLTGGFGIDDYYFSKKLRKVIHCELNKEVSNIAQHNFQVLGVNNIETYTGDGLELLKKHHTVDWIYIDPSRRHDHKGKVFFLEDCLPNVPENINTLFEKSNHILIKTSPLLDINIGIQSLQFVQEIHIVAVHNEVKELLWVLEKGCKEDTLIKAINITKKKTSIFPFTLKEESNIQPQFSLPQKYIYEPNAAILKGGGFSSITKHYKLNKLHINSHLYTSENKIDFPGRSFELLTIIPYQKQSLKKANFSKANITTRNFTETVSQIRKKFKIKDGGDTYLFFTTDVNNNKIVLNCKKTLHYHRF